MLPGGPQLPTDLAKDWSKLWLNQKIVHAHPCYLAVATLDGRLYMWAADSANPLSLDTIPLKVRLSVYFTAHPHSQLLYAKDALEWRRAVDSPAYSSGVKKIRKLDSITESQHECDADHNPVVTNSFCVISWPFLTSS